MFDWLLLLTQGQIAWVSEEDYPHVSKWKWYAHWEPKIQSFYADRRENLRIVSNRENADVHSRIGRTELRDAIRRSLEQSTEGVGCGR